MFVPFIALDNLEILGDSLTALVDSSGGASSGATRPVASIEKTFSKVSSFPHFLQGLLKITVT